MSTLINTCNQDIWPKLSSLQKSVNQTRKAALKKRLVTQPLTTDLEYLLGAFLEMYEPHLEPVVYGFSEKGYVIEVSSGFSGKYSECQSVNGYFSMDYATRGKLEKIGVMLREHNGYKSLVFWPEKANLVHIKDKWMQTVDILPDKGAITSPSGSSEALEFRRKYIPKDPILQKRRLFEQLYYNVRSKIEIDIGKRKIKNPKPDNIESSLGVFVEGLEPQVKEAVMELNRKGYSTDTSGFMIDSCQQMIEGDFQLEEEIVNKLKKLEVEVVTNVSGYTMLQFSPEEAKIKEIEKRWKQIAALLPDKKMTASPSMTIKAREFRRKFN